MSTPKSTNTNPPRTNERTNEPENTRRDLPQSDYRRSLFSWRARSWLFSGFWSQIPRQHPSALWPHITTTWVLWYNPLVGNDSLWWTLCIQKSRERSTTPHTYPEAQDQSQEHYVSMMNHLNLAICLSIRKKNLVRCVAYKRKLTTSGHTSRYVRSTTKYWNWARCKATSLWLKLAYSHQ